MKAPSAAPRTPANVFLAGAQAVAISWGFALVLGFAGVAFLGQGFQPTVAFAAALTVHLVARLARRGDPAIAARTAAFVQLAWFPYLFGLAAFTLSDPIVAGHWRCGTGDFAMLMLGLVSLPVVFGLAIVTALVLEKLRVRWASFGPAAALALVSPIVLAKSAWRLPLSTPDGYLAGLPVVATLSGDEGRFDGPGFVIERAQPPHEQSANARTALKRPGAVCELRGVEQPTDEGGELTESCAGLRVLRDEAHGLWIVVGPGVTGSALAAVDARNPGARAEVTARSVCSSLRPPAPWAIGQAVAALAALVLVGSAAAGSRRTRAWGAATRGQHTGGGWVSFEDGRPPIHLADAVHLPAGHVLVLEAARRATGYREHGLPVGAARVAAGTFEQLVEETRAGSSVLYGLAIVLCLLTLAPMLAAGLNGLLGG